MIERLKGLTAECQALGQFSLVGQACEVGVARDGGIDDGGGCRLRIVCEAEIW